MSVALSIPLSLDRSYIFTYVGGMESAHCLPSSLLPCPLPRPPLPDRLHLAPHRHALRTCLLTGRQTDRHSYPPHLPNGHAAMYQGWAGDASVTRKCCTTTYIHTVHTYIHTHAHIHRIIRRNPSSHLPGVIYTGLGGFDHVRPFV